MDRGAWWATFHGVTRSRTRLRTHTQFRNKSVVLSGSYTFLTHGLPHFKFSLLLTSNFFFVALFYTSTRPLNASSETIMA